MRSARRHHSTSVFVTTPIPEEALKTLKSSCDDVVVWPDHSTLSRKEFLSNIESSDGLLCLLNDRVDGEAIRRMKKMKVIANCAVGFDNIDLRAATRRGIMVTNTPGVLTEATADLTWALILSTARRIPEADRFLRADNYKEWGLMLLLGQPVYGKTLGLVGAGRVGTAVAHRAKGFAMRILYYDPVRNEKLETETGAQRVDLITLLKEADIISIHVPLDKTTRHLIGAKEFAIMKPTAILVNTARGPIVDERALIKALKAKRIAGAGLDVYEHEPKVPRELKSFQNVVLLPHIGSATLETRTRMAVLAAENLVAALDGRIPPNLVNPEVLQKLR